MFEEVSFENRNRRLTVMCYHILLMALNLLCVSRKEISQIYNWLIYANIIFGHFLLNIQADFSATLNIISQKYLQNADHPACVIGLN